MTHEELIAFRDTIAMPKLMELFAKTEIPEGACYIDHLDIQFLDGRNCGHESYFQASGYVWKNGAAEKYTFEEVDITFQDFYEAHKNCIFVSDGKLEVSDELSELDLSTTIRNLDVCGKLFPDLQNLPKLTIEFSPVAYYKLEHLVKESASVVDMDTSGLAVEGFRGTWHTIDHVELDGATYYLMEHDELGDATEGIIVDASGKLMLDEVYEGFDEEVLADLKQTVLSEKLFQEAAYQLNNKLNTTAYGEPQAFVGLENGRVIEVTLEQEMLPPEQQFYSARLHCNEKEEEQDLFLDSVGIVAQVTSKTPSLEEVSKLMYSMLFYNEVRPVIDQCQMELTEAEYKVIKKPLSSLVNDAAARAADSFDRVQVPQKGTER